MMQSSGRIKRRPKQPLPAENLAPPAADADAILQVKVRLTGISHRVRRRVLMPTMFYMDPGASCYEERWRHRVLANLARRAKPFGYVLQQASAPG
jgi:hypothetical protein